MCKTKKKRPLAEEPTSEEKRNKAQKTTNANGKDRSKGTKCSICNKIIIDQSASHHGEDAILCEGLCNGWMHRHCAGLSVPQFAQISCNKDSFLCIYCTLIKQASEINELKQKVQSLSSDMAKSSAKTPDHQSTESPLASNPTVKHKSPPVNPSQHPTTQFQNDRKFNLVIYGIAELPPGTSRHERVTKDTEEVTNIFEKITPSFSGSTLRDCHRLGHYKRDHSRPRPILAKLNRVLDVANILSNNSSYPSTISIKPDLSPEERSCESKLLAERWHLIQSGVDRKSIKIRRPSIYVNGKLHGKVRNSVFINADQLPMETNPVTDQPPEETNTNTSASANMDTHGTNTNTVSHNSNDAPTSQSGQTI